MKPNLIMLFSGLFLAGICHASVFNYTTVAKDKVVKVQTEVSHSESIAFKSFDYSLNDYAHIEPTIEVERPTHFVYLDFGTAKPVRLFDLVTHPFHSKGLRNVQMCS